MTTHEGRVWVFGDNVNTDLIIPGKYLDNYDPIHLASHAMEGVSKEFASQVRRGDLILAGANFGCGSSREQAVIALKHAGIAAVVAESFARIFYRNAVNLGLPVFVSKEASSVFKGGDTVVIDSMSCRVTSKDDTKRIRFEPMPERLQAIVGAGGLVPYLKSRALSSDKGSQHKC